MRRGRAPDRAPRRGIALIWQRAFGNISRHSWRVWQRDADVFRTTWFTNFIPPLLEPVLYVLAFGFGLRGVAFVHPPE